MAITWTYGTAFHLMLRGGFGHDGKLDRDTGESKLVRKLADMTQADAVDYLLDVRPTDRRGPGKTDSNDKYWFKLQEWWFDRMIKAKKPVYEKMVLFLHQHFATARATVDESLYMAIQNALFRQFAFGDFRALVKRVNTDPAMLWWLNGRDNTSHAANENYARELQELFTLGVFDFKGAKNYSQNDVVNAAKILTGWQTDEPKNNSVISFFGDSSDPMNQSFSRHSKVAKTMYAPDPIDTPSQNPLNTYTEPANSSNKALAQTEHERFIDKIFNHVDTDGRPTSARYIARKMWKFFAYDPDVDLGAGTGQQDKALIDALAHAFKGPDAMGQQYNLKTLLHAMFLRDEFYADTTRTVKGPVEYVIGSVRMLGGKLKRGTKDQVVEGSSSSLATMGQELLNPPNVFSWRGNLYWVTTQTLLERYGFASDLAHGASGDDLGYDVGKLLPSSLPTRAAVVDYLLKVLLPDPAVVDTTSRNELIASLSDAGVAENPVDLLDSGVQDAVRDLITLILTMPQFHVH